MTAPQINLPSWQGQCVLTMTVWLENQLPAPCPTWDPLMEPKVPLRSPDPVSTVEVFLRKTVSVRESKQHVSKFILFFRLQTYLFFYIIVISPEPINPRMEYLLTLLCAVPCNTISVALSRRPGGASHLLFICYDLENPHLSQMGTSQKFSHRCSFVSSTWAGL